MIARETRSASAFMPALQRIRTILVLFAATFALSVVANSPAGSGQFMPIGRSSDRASGVDGSGLVRVAEKGKGPKVRDIAIVKRFDKSSPILKSAPGSSGPSLKPPRDPASGRATGKRH
jgi:hypothetical protein